MLCHDPTSRLSHQPLPEAHARAPLLDLPSGLSLHVGLREYMANSEAALDVVLPSGSLQGWRIHRHADLRSLCLSRDGHLLIAEEGGRVLAQRSAEQGHRFLAISAADLGILRRLLDSQWLLASAQRVFGGGHIVLEPNFMLRVGPQRFDLRWNLPFPAQEFPFRLTLLRDGWRIDRLFLHRPLVYYAVCGTDAYVAQFALSLLSLCAIGGYDGDVLVLTDRAEAAIQRLRPPMMRGALHVVTLPTADWYSACAARLAVEAWPEAGHHQPLLYVDTDILFNRPVEPMLNTIAQARDILTATEWTEPLATSPFVGGDLIRRDERDPGDALGFNSGTLGIPNLREHGATLALVAQLMANLGALDGRKALLYCDQEIMNYVGFAGGGFDTKTLSPFVQLASESAVPADASGLVHFCWVDGGCMRRVEVMRDYLLALRPRRDPAQAAL